MAPPSSAGVSTGPKARAAQPPASTPEPSAAAWAAELVLSVLPGSGEALAARDSMRHGDEAARYLRDGRLGDAALAYVNSLTAGIGALPLVGGMMRGAKAAVKVGVEGIDVVRAGARAAVDSGSAAARRVPQIDPGLTRPVDVTKAFDQVWAQGHASAPALRLSATKGTWTDLKGAGAANAGNLSAVYRFERETSSGFLGIGRKSERLFARPISSGFEGEPARRTMAAHVLGQGLGARTVPEAFVARVDTGTGRSALAVVSRDAGEVLGPIGERQAARYAELARRISKRDKLESETLAYLSGNSDYRLPDGTINRFNQGVVQQSDGTVRLRDFDWDQAFPSTVGRMQVPREVPEHVVKRLAGALAGRADAATFGARLGLDAHLTSHEIAGVHARAIELLRAVEAQPSMIVRVGS